jgi:alpha-1,6-mannosyltransferase
VTTAVCWLIAVGGMALVALLGPSAAVRSIPGGSGWPPYSLSVHPPTGLVFTIEVLAVAAGAVAAWRMQTAARQDRGPGPRRLQAAGFLAAAVLTLLPPAGSEDLLSYLAYGQESRAGINPYLLGPQSPGVPQDALTRAVEFPWQFTPSVYGPAFTRISTVVAHLAHGDGHIAATLVRLLLTGAFVVTGVLLFALSPTVRDRRRAVALWSANPLMLFALVAGAHVDVLVVALLTAALALVGRSPLAAGVLAGLAATVKLNGLIVLPGLLWAVRARRRTVLAVLLGAAAVALTWYATTPGVFTQLRHISQYTTPAMPWRAVRWLLEPLLGPATARSFVPTLAGIVGLVLVALLFRRGLPAATGTPTGRAAAVTATFAVGYLLTAPYVLPWYDALAWAPLVLAGASVLDRLVLVHTTALTYALLPGRQVPLPEVVDLTVRAMHSVVSPVVLLVVAVVAFRAALRRPQPAPLTGRSGRIRGLEDWG